MSLIADLLAEPCRNARGDRLEALRGLARALETGETGNLPDIRRACAERMRQAEEKIAAAAPVARTGELLALAQFGAGSAGTAIADVYGCPDADAGLQSLYIARFLTDIVVQRDTCPWLFPEDSLKRHSVARGDLPTPSADAVHRELLERAREAAARCRGTGASAPRELAVLTALETRLVRKRARMLSKGGDRPRSAKLGLWDRIAVAVSFRLRLRGAT